MNTIIGSTNNSLLPIHSRNHCIRTELSESSSSAFSFVTTTACQSTIIPALSSSSLDNQSAHSLYSLGHQREASCNTQSENHSLLNPQVIVSRDPLSHDSNSCGLQSTNSRHFDISSASITDEADDCFCQTCYPSKTRHFSCKGSRQLTTCLSAITNCLLLPTSWRCRLVRRHIPNENLFVLSIIQLLCGFAAVILSSVALTKTVFLYQMATGMWAGFFMLVTGTQGLITARRPIVCTLVGLLVLCMVTTTSACLLIGVSVAGTIEDGFLHRIIPQSKSSTYQVIKFTYAFQNQHPFKSVFSDQMNFLKGPFNLSAASPMRFRAISGDMFTPASNSHLRTCQVIIHVLLLLVGVLESSVGLSTCVICCRYVNSHYGRSRNQYNARTNIVSFDSATASQAAAVLESGAVSRILGTGNVLLAIAPDSLAQNEPTLPRSENESMYRKPCVHHTVAPFIPKSNRSALILTQAGIGSMAWTAARAAAALVDRNGFSTNTPDTDRFRTSRSFRGIEGVRCRRWWTHAARRTHRSRLMFTSLHVNRLRTEEVRRPTNMIGNDAETPFHMPGSTLLYVMPSPSGDEPPMIFPPFPPTYSSFQRRPLPTATRYTRRPHTTSARPLPENHEDERLIHTSPLHSIRRLPIFNRFRTRRSLTSNSNGNRTVRPVISNVRGSPSTPICAVDRLLQPVLIVENPKAYLSPSTLPPDPPKYSQLDPNLHFEFK